VPGYEEERPCGAGAQGVDVSFLTSRGRLRGSLVSGHSRNVFLRLAQFDRWKDPEFRVSFSRHVVAAKLTAQERLIARYQRNHPDQLEAEAAGKIRQLIDKTATAESVDSLQGLEGSAAAVYYRQFGLMLKGVPFPGRKKHPSTDPANALLSLGYVLLGNEIAALLEARGFDPAVGFLHGLRYGRSSLALDVVEIFRQPVIDRLTLRLLNRRQLSPDDFEGGPAGLRLSPDALKSYLALYEEQLRSESEGKDTPTWRARLQEQADSLREMVMTGHPVPLYTWKDRISAAAAAEDL
jgi:CRISP-associated protein Cas1